MASLRRVILPIVEARCFLFGQTRSSHLKSYPVTKIANRRSPRVKQAEKRSEAIRVQKAYDPEDCLPPISLLNSARKSGALSLESEAVITFLRQFQSYSDKNGRSWEQKLCKDHEITPEHLLLLSKILGRCNTKAQRSLAKRLLLLSASLGSPSANFEIIQQALRIGTLSEFPDALYQLGALAKKGEPQAMALLGKVLLTQNKEQEALDWFRKATQPPTGNTDFHGAGEALVNEGHLLMRRADIDLAEVVLKKAALELDEPFGYFYLSQLQEAGSQQQELFLKKAASSGVAEAAHNLGALELGKVDIDAGDHSSDAVSHKSRPRKEKGKVEYAMAIEWFSVAAQGGFGLSMLNLAMVYKIMGDVGTGLAWLEKAEQVPEVEEQARAVRESW